MGDQEGPAERDEQQVRILDALLRRGPMSRSQLVRRTGYTRAIVADRISDLVEQGVVESEQTSNSVRGRPAALNRLAPGYGHVLSAVAGFSHVRIALFDAAQGLVAQRVQGLDPSRPAAAIVDQVADCYRRLATEAPVTTPLRGICVGLPSPVQYPAGILVAPPDLPHWDGFEMNRAFERALGAPCWTDNEVNLMAVGEHLARHGRPDDLLFVKIGHGIGTGIIGGGRLHRGADGSAGDIGHNRVPGSTVACPCGRRGCLGVTAGAQAWARRGWDMSGLLRERRGLPAGPDADPVSESDHAPLDVVMRESGMAIGEALAALVNFFNPSLIVLGGSMVLGGDLLIATIRQAVYANALPLATRRLSMERSVAEEMAGVTGAAFMAISGVHHLGVEPSDSEGQALVESAG